MIKRLTERWVGYDRLLVAYEKLKSDNDDLTEEHARLRRRLRSVSHTHENTVARLQRQRVELNRLRRRYTQALVDLEWERFLREVNDLGSDDCEKIRLMSHDQAWEVADLLAERFGKAMYAHRCDRCPTNPITHDHWWHVTRKKNRRRT